MTDPTHHTYAPLNSDNTGVCLQCGNVGSHSCHQPTPARETAVSAAETDQQIAEAIAQAQPFCAPFYSGQPNPCQAAILGLIAAVEALQERVAKLERLDAGTYLHEIEHFIERAEAAEARMVELEGALKSMMDTHAGKDMHGVGDYNERVQSAKLGWAALASTPTRALERARATDEVIDQADEVYTRLLVLSLAGKFNPPDKAVKTELEELGRRLANLDALQPAKEDTGT